MIDLTRSRCSPNFFSAVLLALSFVCGAPALAAEADSKTFSEAELDQLTAPVALYPDELVSQVLMASTYPLEDIQAHRWVKENHKLKGDKLAKALEKQS